MAGRKEISNVSVHSLREQAARLTLRRVRAQGHIYVEVREDNKRFIFYCILCLAPCYSDSSLFDHLRGHLHKERYATAKATQLGSWPFNDGVHFFHDCSQQDKCSGSSKDRLLNFSKNDSIVNVVRSGKTSNSNGESNVGTKGVDHNKNLDSQICVLHGHDKNLNADGESNDLVIPGVLWNDEITSLEVKLIGVGEIAARIREYDETSDEISRIWCAWLGKRNSHDEDVSMIPVHDFGVVTFSYNYNLGRRPLVGEFAQLCDSSPWSEVENVEGRNKRKRKSFSDPEDISESLSEQGGSPGEEDYQGSDSPTSKLVPLVPQFQHSKSMSKNMRRALRKQERIAAERMCEICQIKILPGKDAASLLNMKTGRLVCSSRNKTGAFHVYHTSCLLHWILLCEYEIWTNQLASPEVTTGSRRKVGAKRTKKQMEYERSLRKQIFSVFCPECHGTGIDVEEDELEQPRIHLSEMFNYKIKSKDAQRAWMKDPEILQNASTGLHFPRQFNETVQEKVAYLRLLHFYRADDIN